MKAVLQRVLFRRAGQSDLKFTREDLPLLNYLWSKRAPAPVAELATMEKKADQAVVVPKARAKSSILIVTIPKSGTVYMNAMFRDGLGLDNYILSNRYFPVDQLYLDAMPEFSKGGYVASAHIDPSLPNLQILEQFVPKWILHFRDPRSVTLSWVHHMERLAEEGRFVDMLRVCPVPPRELHGWSLERRIDWHLDNFLPHVTRWMTDWIQVAEAMPDRVLVTEFGELREQEEIHSGRILDFLGISRSAYTHRPPAKAMSSHFRTGTYDEWRTSFTPAQQEKATSKIPSLLMTRFGWPS